MSFELFLTLAARRDLRDSANWYEEQETGLGDRFVQTVDRRLDDVSRSPLMFRVCSPRGARRCIVHGWPYIIYYKIFDQTVAVVAIIHTSRDPKYLNYRLR